MAQPLKRSLAILEISASGSTPEQAQTISVRQMAEISGTPFIITQSITEAAQQAVIITTDDFDGTNLTDVQRQALINYVQNGGILISPNFKDLHLFNLFGISGESFSRNRYAFTFDGTKSEKLFRLIDDPRERTIPLGDQAKGKAVLSRSYVPGNAQVLARFDDNSAAIVRNHFGDGYAYAIGISFKDVIVRNELNRDFSANRIYSNGFELVSDIFGLLLRNIMTEHISHNVWKHTSPSNSSAALIITHDVDAESSMKLMNQFASFEEDRDITATYLVTTHYINDGLDGDYYTAYRDSVSKLHQQKQYIGSHSVGHFPDFNDLPLGSLGQTRSTYHPAYHNEETSDGSVLGEVEVSKKLLEEDVTPQKLKAFRAPYLIYPDKLVNALDTLGYTINSSFSANDVLSSFPYREFKDRSFHGALSQVWELPVTLTDVVDSGFVDHEQETVDLWAEVTKKYDANSAPVILLIHPDREAKLDAEKQYLNRLPPGMITTSLKGFHDFWIQRNNTLFSTKIEGNSLGIYLENHKNIPDSLSFVISEGADLDNINVYGSDDSRLSVSTEQQENGNILVYNNLGQIPDSSQSAMSEPVKISPNFPNPFNEQTNLSYELKEKSKVRIDIYTITGQKVQTLFNKVQSKGPHQKVFDGNDLASGIYLYMLRVNSYNKAAKMTLIK